MFSKIPSSLRVISSTVSRSNQFPGRLFRPGGLSPNRSTPGSFSLSLKFTSTPLGGRQMCDYSSSDGVCSESSDGDAKLVTAYNNLTAFSQLYGKLLNGPERELLSRALVYVAQGVLADDAIASQDAGQTALMDASMDGVFTLQQWLDQVRPTLEVFIPVFGEKSAPIVQRLWFNEVLTNEEVDFLSGNIVDRYGEGLSDFDGLEDAEKEMVRDVFNLLKDLLVKK